MSSAQFRRAHNRSQPPNPYRSNTLVLFALLLSIWAQPVAAESTLRATTHDSWLPYRGNWARTCAAKAQEPTPRPGEHPCVPNLPNIRNKFPN